MNYRALIVVFFVFGVLITALTFLCEIIKFNQTGDKKYNFLTYFPYELNQFRRSNKGSYLLVITSFIGGACFISSSLMFAFIYKGMGATSAYIFATVSGLSIIVFNILRFLKMNNFKLHLAFSSCYLFLNLLLLILYYIFFTNMNYGYCIITGKRITLMIYILVLILFEFYLMINKSYKEWARMVKLDEGGYSRPKKCYLAMIEWGNYLIYILSFVTLFLLLFV